MFKQCLIIAAGCSFLFSSTSSAGLFFNSSFSSDLSGWTVEGSAAWFGGGAVLTDNEPRSMLYQGALLTPGDYFLSFDYIQGLSGNVPPGQANDTIFTTLYFSSTPGSFHPLTPVGFDSFTALVDVDASTNAAVNGSVGPSPLGGSFLQYTTAFTMTQTSTVYLVFDLVDLNSVRNDSSIFIDNVSLVVPEPSIFGLFMAGASVALTRSLRRRI